MGWSRSGTLKCKPRLVNRRPVPEDDERIHYIPARNTLLMPLDNKDMTLLILSEFSQVLGDVDEHDASSESA